MRAVLTVMLVIAVRVGHGQEADVDVDHLRTLGGKDAVDDAVRRGLKYLVSRQDKRTGAFNENNVPNAMTGIACLALMSNGSVPGEGRYGTQLHAGILYLIGAAKKNKGYFGNESTGKMYSHGICTIALCEAYGMMPTQEENRRLGEAVGMAVKVIIDGQISKKGKYLGGWHYLPKSTQADLSVTVWQILAIKAALNCNVDVPKNVIENAIGFVRRFYNVKAESFTYDQNRVTHATRASGVVSLLALGAGKDGKDAGKIRNAAGPLLNLNLAQGDHLYCQSLYLAMCANALGGKYEKMILPNLQKMLLSRQDKNGAFKNETKNTFGGVYTTAFAVLSLSVRRQLLPALQN